MKTLSNLFDRYEISARIIPSLIVISPPIFSCYIWFPQIQTFTSAMSGAFLILGIVIIMAKYVRMEGKRKEKILYRRWGGIPTTSILRHNDKSIDPITKRRYISFLQDSVGSLIMPSKEEECSNPEEADLKYESAVKWLREKTRNKEEYPLVFEENINYGFVRNLWAIKPLGLFILISTLLINLYAVRVKYGINIMLVPMGLKILFLLLTLMLCLWIFFVTPNLVYTYANIYAQTLLGSCDKLNKNNNALS